MLLMGIDTSALKDSDVHLLRFLLRAVPLGLAAAAVVGFTTWATVDLTFYTEWMVTGGHVNATPWTVMGVIGFFLYGGAGIVGTVLAFTGVISLVGKAYENIQEHYESFKDNTPIEGRD